MKKVSGQWDNRLHPFLWPLNNHSTPNLMKLPISPLALHLLLYTPSHCLWYGPHDHWHLIAILFYLSLPWFFILGFCGFLSLDSVIYTVVRESILKCSPDQAKLLLEIFNKLPSAGENLQAPQTQSSGSCLAQAYHSGHSLLTCCSLPSPVSHPTPGNPLPPWRGHFLILHSPFQARLQPFITMSHPR